MPYIITSDTVGLAIGPVSETLLAVKVTVQESRALVARSRGKPYLASQFGRSTIRD